MGNTRSNTAFIYPSDVNAGTLGSMAVGATATAVTMTLRSNTFGRRGRGRVFIPFTPQTGVKDGRIQLTTPYPEALGLLRAAVLSFNLAGDDGWAAKPIVFSPSSSNYQAGPHCYITPHADYMTDATVNPILRIMRRREVGVGM
jgi:hypothetical protein